MCRVSYNCVQASLLHPPLYVVYVCGAHCADAEGGVAVAAGCSVSPLESKKCGCWWWRVSAVSVPSPTRDIEQHNLATAQSRENFPGDSELRLSFLATDLVVRPQTSTDKYITYIVFYM